MTRAESKREMLDEMGAVPVIADALDPDQVVDAVGRAKPDVIISGATGVKDITDEEQAALTDLAPNAAIHASGDVIGHTMEGQAPAGVAMAAALIARGESTEALVTSVGHWRGEGSIRLTRAS